MTIRARQDGWQVIVYAGLDPLTGTQRQLTRQVNDSLHTARQVEAELRAEITTGAMPAPPPPSTSWSTCGSSGAPPAASRSRRTPLTTIAG